MVFITDSRDNPNIIPKRGIAINSGFQSNPRKEIPKSMKLSRYHSGVSGSDARVVPAHHYDVVGMELRRDSQPLALNIEDVQIAYQDSSGTWYCYNASHTTAPTDMSDLRVVEVNVVARTNVEDTADTSYAQPSVEDHTVSSPPSDGYRRRTLTTKVKLRNLGI